MKITPEMITEHGLTSEEFDRLILRNFFLQDQLCNTGAALVLVGSHFRADVGTFSLVDLG